MKSRYYVRMSFVSIGENRVVKVTNSPNHICKYDGALILQVIKPGTGTRNDTEQNGGSGTFKLKSNPNLQPLTWST